jgi:hypothetical protein
VYVEVNPESQMITDVQVPVTGHLHYLEQDPGGELNFALDSSQRRFSIQPSNPLYPDFQKILREAHEQQAMIIVTENDEEEEIVDIRLAPNPTGPALREAEGTAPALVAPRLRPVTLQRATALFGMVHCQSCNPKTGAPPCIPFLYARDGCYARAHQMCRLIIADGDEPGKIWNFGHLTVKTPNEPRCEVSWWFHVAPVLQVDTAGPLGPQLYIVDPSLFPGPVPVQNWVAVQGNRPCDQKFTSSEPYLPQMNERFRYDPTYTKTEKDLAHYRAALRRRCGAHGPPPPPYAKCLEGASASAVIAGPSSFTEK